MILIWKGAAPLVVLLAALVAGGIGIGLSIIAPGTVVARIAFPVGAIIAGIVTIIAGFKLNSYGNRHSLYFIPVQYWGFVIIVFGFFLFAGDPDNEGSVPDGSGSIADTEIVSLPAGIRTEKRSWSNTKGRKMTGTLIGLSPDCSRVRIKKSTGKIVEVGVDAFSPQDQDYIRRVHRQISDQRGALQEIPCPLVQILPAESCLPRFPSVICPS